MKKVKITVVESVVDNPAGDSIRDTKYYLNGKRISKNRFMGLPTYSYNYKYKEEKDENKNGIYKHSTSYYYEV